MLRTPRHPGTPTSDPASFQFVSPRLGAVLVAIPKNGCTAQKQFLLRAESCFDDGWPHGAVHAAARRFGLDAPGREAEAAGLPRIVFLRDPFRRLVSAFCNKLVRTRLNLPSVSAIEGHARLWGIRIRRDALAECAELKREPLAVSSAIDYRRGLTFREFVEYVCATPDRELDAHWRPQAWFVPDHPLVRLHDLGRLPAVLAGIAIERGIATEPVAPAVRTPAEPEPCMLAEIPSGELAARSVRPSVESLFTSDLLERVESRYAADLRLHASTGAAAPRPTALDAASAAGRVA